jgi:hypothetical protein
MMPRLFVCLLACNHSALDSGPVRILSGAWALVGVSDDGLLVRDQNHQILSLPLSGGPPTLIGPGEFAFARNGIVFVRGAFDDSSTSQSLASWTPGGGYHLLSSAPSFNAPRVSRDGQWLIFFDNVTSDGWLADLVSARSDGSQRQTLESQVPIIGCLPSARTLGAAWLFAWCQSYDRSTDTADGTLESFDPVANTRTVLLAHQPHQPMFDVDASATSAFVADGSGNGLLYDSSLHSSLIDNNVLGGGFTSDGAILYLTTIGELRRHQQGTITALATQVRDVDDLSPDGKTVLVSRQSDPQSPWGLDLWATSAQTPSAARAILSAPTGYPAAFAGIASFTQDSSYVLYFDPWSTSFYGPLHAAPTTGGAAALLANDVVSGFPTHDRELVLCANLDQTQHCDLIAVDAAHPSNAAAIAGHVPAHGVYLTGHGGEIAWSVENPDRPADDGIYVLAAP